MRTLIDLPDPTIKALAQLTEATGQSRSALVRQAIDQFIDSHNRPLSDDAFGLWVATEDGVALQTRLRGEW